MNGADVAIYEQASVTDPSFVDRHGALRTPRDDSMKEIARRVLTWRETRWGFVRFGAETSARNN